MIKEINNQGMTLIEVIVALAIAGIVMACISSFLIFNTNTFQRTQNLVEMQQDAQLTMNNIVNRLMLSDGIKTITLLGDSNPESDLSRLSGELEIEKIEFYIPELKYNTSSGDDDSVTITEKDKIISIFLDRDTGELIYKQITDPNGEGIIEEEIISNQISNFKINTLSENYEVCNSVELTLVLESKGVEKIVNNQVRMRNKN